MRNYQQACQDLSVPALAARLLSGSLDGGLNAAVECCDRWAGRGAPALRWIDTAFHSETLGFDTLREQSARFANLLTSRGIGRGDVVAGLLPRIPELLVVILGTWRAGAIYQPLFTAFGPAAIASRVTAAQGSRAKLIVTDGANEHKLADVADAPPHLRVDRSDPHDGPFGREMATQSTDFAPVMLRGDDPFILLFTSGTTGSPKGVCYPLRLLLASAIYMQDGIGLQPDDRFWNVADPGWAYGMLYAVLGPLQLGHCTTFFEGGFTVPAAVRVIAEHGIDNLAAAPTVYRLMMAAGEAALAPIAGRLRVASSAGEPLNPEVVRWAQQQLKVPLCDHYGQSETGMMINNHHALAHPRKPGAAGLPMPGFTLALLDGEGRPIPAGTPDTPGVLAVDRTRSPLFTFGGYWHADTPSFQGNWYVTGDTMQRDADGHYFFVGRNDDIITSAGYRIGPFDVESVLMEHPAVAEVAVVGKPDPERTEIVKAFIVLRAGVEASDLLIAQLQQHVRSRLSLHAYPREITFLPELPKTPSGKVQRFLLRRE